MSEQQSSYRQIMKATSLFGGVQVFSILIAIIRSKFVAVLLGPMGMGIAGLLNATIGLIAGLTNFGLETSAVKDISEAQATGNDVRISIVSIVLKRLVWATGILGAVITLVCAQWLSLITFGTKEYTFAFIWISVTLLLNQISIGQSVLLRGMRKLSYLAQSGMIGSALGLIITIPLYYFYGIKGIVPGIIVSSVITLSISWYYVKKIPIKPVKVSKKETLTEGTGMLKMGFMISLSGLITIGASYLVRIFISNTGGIEEVGLYNAGFSIINTYVGMIFTAMSTDYFPRLSAFAENNEKVKTIVNQQTEIALLLLAPIIMIFLVFIKWGVILLYSTKFVLVNEMILWAALGMFFKGASWAIAFILLAKGASKMFFLNELVANVYLLVFNLIGYKYGGLKGLGISFLLSYFIYFIQVYIITNINYKFSFNNEFYKIFGIQFFLAIAAFLTMKLLVNPWSYFLGSGLIILSFICAFKELDKRIDIKSIILSIKKEDNEKK